MNEQQQPTSQKPSRGSPKQSTIARIFYLVHPRSHLKKMLIEVGIDITSVPDIVFHMVAISTYNKNNVRC